MHNIVIFDKFIVDNVQMSKQINSCDLFVFSVVF